MVDCLSAVRILCLSILGAGFGVGISLVVGLAILEVPFSLPFAITLGIILVLLGGLLLMTMILNRRRPHAGESAFETGLLLSVEIFLMVIIGILSIFGGAFSMWLFFEAKSLPIWASNLMFIVLGTALTVIISVNLLDLVELLLQCCNERRIGALKATVATSRRLFPMRTQNWLIILVAVASGVYYGYMYGSLARKELNKGTSPVGYDPWPIVVAWLSYSLPVAAVGGFLVLIIALSLPLLCSRGGGQGQAWRSGSKKNDGVASGGAADKGTEAPLLPGASAPL